MRGLQPVADDLAPTVRDLRALAPDLKATFRSLDPLITRSRTALPALTRTVKGARPLVAALNPFLGELNPILAMLQYNQVRLAGFITNGTPGIDGDFGGQRYNNVVGMVDPRSFTNPTERPADDRGQAYLPPNFANRLIAMGGFETTDCCKAVGPRNQLRRRAAQRRADRAAAAEELPALPLVPGGGPVAVRRQDRAAGDQGPHRAEAAGLGHRGHDAADRPPVTATGSDPAALARFANRGYVGVP